MTIDELVNHIEAAGHDVSRDGVTLSAGGYLDLSSLTSLPEGVTLSARLVLANFPACEYRGRSVECIDGMAMVTGAWRDVDGVSVCRATYLGRGIDSELVYIARSGEHTAHGDTVREAIEDVAAKVLGGDPTAVLAEIRSTGVVTRAQYRALTGACGEGVRQWCESHGIGDDVESLPVEQVIEMTSGYYGSERLAQLVGEVAP